MYSRKRTGNKNYKTDSSERETASSDNCYSVRCEPGGVDRHNDKTLTVDDNGYELRGLTQQTSAESHYRPRIARRPPLPIDRRSLSIQSGETGGSAAAVERGRLPASRYGSRSTVSGVSGVDADVRQLIDEVRCQDSAKKTFFYFAVVRRTNYSSVSFTTHLKLPHYHLSYHLCRVSKSVSTSDAVCLSASGRPGC